MPDDYPRIKISPEAKRNILTAAREHRKSPTKSEKILWKALRGKKRLNVN